MGIGEIINFNGCTYKVTKQVDDYSYEICDIESGTVSLYAVGRPVPDEQEESAVGN